MRSNNLLKLLAVVFFFSAFLAGTNAQEEEKKYGIKFSGFVKADYMFDSRQTVTAREGHFLLFPAGESLDSNGDDINATPNFNALAIQSRLKGTISGPDFFNMKTSGVIEGAFFGHSNADINGFRLRHAFMKLSGENVDIIMGQYWHPLFITACFPGVYSFNTGVPFQPFSRNPQVRVSTKGSVKVIGTLYSQRDFSSRGPAGTTSTYLRNSAIPGLNGQFQFASGGVTAGVAADYKITRPSLTDPKTGDKSENTLGSYALLGYVKAKTGGATVKLEAVYGNNLADLLMLGGIAEADSEDGGYTNSTTMSVWGEVSGGSTSMEWGLFGGYTKNMGLDANLSGSLYGLGSTIDNVMRVSPRVAWKSGKTKIGLELEYTAATYGSIAQGEMEVNSDNVDAVSNIRLLVTGVYKF